MRKQISLRHALSLIFCMYAFIVYSQENTAELKRKWSVERFEFEKISPESIKAQQDLIGVFLTFDDKELVVTKKTQSSDSLINRGQYFLSGTILTIGKDQANILLLSEQYLTIKIPGQGTLYLKRG